MLIHLQETMKLPTCSNFISTHFSPITLAPHQKPLQLPNETNPQTNNPIWFSQFPLTNLLFKFVGGTWYHLQPSIPKKISWFSNKQWILNQMHQELWIKELSMLCLIFLIRIFFFHFKISLYYKENQMNALRIRLSINWNNQIETKNLYSRV